MNASSRLKRARPMPRAITRAHVLRPRDQCAAGQERRQPVSLRLAARTSTLAVRTADGFAGSPRSTAGRRSQGFRSELDRGLWVAKGIEDVAGRQSVRPYPMSLSISLTCADYARIMPLATGEVKPDGCAHDDPGQPRLVPRAPRCSVARCRSDGAVVSGRWAVSLPHRQGDRRYVGLPCSRCATSRAVTCTCAEAADPVGRGSGRQAHRMYSYTASGSIWYRIS